MTRKGVYSGGLVLTVLCTGMTIASIAMPRWVSQSSSNGQFHMGLHSYYSSIKGTYAPFPSESDCSKDQSFCHMWRTVGFLISFDVVAELCTLVAFVVILGGGVQRRTAGWKILCVLLIFTSFVQCMGMGIVTYLYEHHERFSDKWYLDNSWSLCTASWIILLFTSLGMIASALCLPPEGEYEMIPDEGLEVVQDEQLASRIGAWNDGYRNNSEGYQSYQQDTQSIRSQRSTTQ